MARLYSTVYISINISPPPSIFKIAFAQQAQTNRIIPSLLVVILCHCSDRAAESVLRTESRPTSICHGQIFFFLKILFLFSLTFSFYRHVFVFSSLLFLVFLPPLSIWNWTNKARQYFFVSADIISSTPVCAEREIELTYTVHIIASWNRQN